MKFRPLMEKHFINRTNFFYSALYINKLAKNKEDKSNVKCQPIILRSKIHYFSEYATSHLQ